MPKLSRKRRIILSLIVSIPLIGGGLTWSRWRLAAQVEQAIAAIRAAGDPATADDLVALRRDLPPEQNAALVLIRLGERLSQATANTPGLPLLNFAPLPGLEPIPDPERAVIRNFAETHRSLLDEMRAASRMPDAQYSRRFDRDSAMNWRTDGIYAMSHTVSGLMLASLDAALRSDPAAADDVSAQLRIAATLDGEPLFDALATRRMLNAVAAVSLEQIISRVALQPSRLQTLADELHQAEALGALRSAYVADRANVIQFTRHELARHFEASDQSIGNLIWFHTGQSWGLMDRLTLDVITDMNAAVNAATLPPEQRLPALNAIAAASSTSYRESAREYTNALSCLSDLRSIAKLRAARVAVLVEHYRVEQDRLPDTLDDLGFDDLPTDPFTGYPFCYVTGDAGSFKVYSVGPDGVDDGGTTSLPPDPNAGPPVINLGTLETNPGTDIVFEVRPELRRIAAPADQ